MSSGAATLDVLTASLGDSAFDQRVAERTLSVGVIGLGYTGLPLALAFAGASVRVVGYDIDAAKIEALRGGTSYLVEIGDAELAAGDFTPTGDPRDLAGCDAVIICVPTPLTNVAEPDLRHIDSALQVVQQVAAPGSLVVVQSTVPPGTTSSCAQRLAATTGLEVGCDLFVAMAPERIDPGNTAGWTVANTPRVVGGITAECTRRAVALFSLICTKVVAVSTAETAETAKVFENTFRLVNIALTYELSALCGDLGISTHEVIDAASTKPFGFLAHRPGPGVGGECIPVDPMFLVAMAERTGVDLPLISGAYEQVVRRPREVVERLAAVAKDRAGDLDGGLAGERVLLAGASYKPEIGDVRNAPAIGVIRELRRRGASVAYADPFVPDLEVDGVPVHREEFDEQAVAGYDHVILLTRHGALMDSPAWLAARSVLDTWHVLPPSERVARL